MTNLDGFKYWLQEILTMEAPYVDFDFGEYHKVENGFYTIDPAQ
jgi:hypothetical protein